MLKRNRRKVLMALRNQKAKPPIAGSAICSVWLVTWEQQDGPKSGVHGVFEGEQNARDVALGMSRNTRGVIYKASSWLVTPNIRS
jgi:hypothetical protein